MFGARAIQRRREKEEELKVKPGMVKLWIRRKNIRLTLSSDNPNVTNCVTL